MSNPRSQITVTQKGIGEILKQFQLKVPPNQRDYSWTELEVTTLFQDLAKAIADNEPEYFLGTISTIPDSSGILEVIDGQQRLATITILLSQIRRYLLDKDAVIAEDVKSFLVYIDRSQRATLPKLRLNLVDNDFLRAMLSDDSAVPPPLPTRRSHRLICDAFNNADRYVKKIVGGFDTKAHGDILNKWIDFIEFGATVILLQVPTGANLYKMFETLNDRGLKTSQADLVKNYLFSQAKDRLSEVQNSWSLMRGALESLQEEEKEDITVTFLRHALIAIQGFLRKDKVFEVVQQSGKGSQASVALLKKIENLAGVYVATFYRDHEKWNSYPDAMRLAIQTVNFFDIHPFRPTLLSVASKFSPKEAIQAFQMFIALAVRLIIASSTRSGVIEETLAAAANKVFTGQISTARELKKEISGIVPTDERFRQAFEIATVSKGPLARYYLRALERVAKKEPDPWYTLNDDKELINLEHVLPEKPEENWPQFNEEEVGSYYKRIGNMVLLQHRSNSDLKSADFKTKSIVYKDSPYKLTAQIATVKEWTVETICDRQRELAILALKAWPI